MKAELIKVDGTSESIIPKNGNIFQDSEIQELLECTNFEKNDLKDNKIMLYGTDKDRNFSENKVARNIIKSSLNTSTNYQPSDNPLGSVIICDSKMI